ncbi:MULTISPECIES: RICIN domain-containing protein [unclassified Streptomyces]|uniref:RICIN domain-containing protein n=1 Tax=unclassified Streptomyces TaxID=2593676 RepID=UPI00224F65FB|nr:MULTISPECIES: RICIN domain-containing protein [unclassified Streptomyces]MCX4405163.1 ricin-type beta-trefoil lectin domain protein [Streptomyces sp. NBC_01764]MCX5190288.1 ricin-type beta-trefoil lectin domain protein [Streptomyces sp. NBC_00268]
MSLWTSLEPASSTVDPGGSTKVRLRLRNTGDVVDEYRFEPVGDVAPWTVVEPQTLRLYPGTTGTVELTFSPPRSPDAVAGPNPFAVRITPTEHPEATTVPEGNLTITPFTEVRAELVPPTVKGRFRGRPKLAVDNLGNTRLTASVSGSDNGDHLSYDIHPSNVQVEPGRAVFVRATLKPRQIIWFGSKEQRPYSLAIQRSGTGPQAVEGTYVQRGFLPRWLATFLGVFMALAITFVMLWIAYKPKVSTAATEKLQEAGISTLPAPTPSLSAAPSSAPPEVPAPSQAQQTPESGGGGGGGGGAVASPKATKKTATGPLPATNIVLRNPTTKKCADIPGYDKGSVNGPVREFTCDGTTHDNQLWNLEVREKGGGPEKSDLFQIRNVKDQMCMDLPDYGAKPAQTGVFEFQCDGTTADNQLWWLDKQDDGHYWIRNYSSNHLCLDVAGFSTGGNDTPLTIYYCSKTDDQEWDIVHPS